MRERELVERDGPLDWLRGAQWHHSGLPANMEAVLYDQWKRHSPRSIHTQ